MNFSGKEVANLVKVEYDNQIWNDYITGGAP